MELRPEFETWRSDILTHFPDWGTDAALVRWPDGKSKLRLWQEVSGTAIALAPFGAWVDIAAGHPALLLITEMGRSGSEPHFPHIGAVVQATIVVVGDNCEIGLSKFPSGSYWSNQRPKNSQN
jgi:hypothetical protein